MQTETINVEAMQSALNLMFGDKAAEMVAKVYVAIDQAQHRAYSKGQIEGYNQGVDNTRGLAKADAEENVEERLNNTWDNGFMAGYDAAEDASVASEGARYDEGYLAGVDDARRRPAVADEEVQDIINVAAQHALNGEYDASLVTDSGDETVFKNYVAEKLSGYYLQGAEWNWDRQPISHDELCAALDRDASTRG